MHPILTGFVSTLLFSVHAAQGIYVRQNSMQLSPAVGPRSGQVGEGKPVIRLLTVGDSSAAAEAMAPQLAAKLHARDGVSVSWHISGQSSAVAGEIRDVVVPNLKRDDYTHILNALGTNDLKNWHTSRCWKKEFGDLLYALRTRFQETKFY